MMYIINEKLNSKLNTTLYYHHHRSKGL